MLTIRTEKYLLLDYNDYEITRNEQFSCIIY